MKTALFIALASVAAVSASAQGFVNFALGAVPARVYAATDVFDPTGVSAASTVTGTGYFAQLYAASGTGISEANLVAVGSAVNFRAGANAGFNIIASPVNPSVQVTAVNGGAATVQVRVWSSAFATYELALASGSGAVQVGKSAVISFASTGAAGGGTPPNLAGLTSFQLAPVPEPSTIALAGLGLGGLLLARRKKA